MAQEITKGNKDAISRHPGIRIVVDQAHRGWARDLALATTENALVAQNGQIQTHGEKIAVLEDRASEGRTAGRNWGLTAGGIGSAIAAALAYLFGGGVK